MADLTNLAAVRDGSATFTVQNGAASQTLVLDGVRDEKFCLYASNSDATTARIKIKAGTGFRSTLGDMDVDIAQNVAKIIGPLDSARFKDPATGKVTVQILDTDDSSYGGTVTNVKLLPIVLP